MIGWYVHHHGWGHATRMRAIRPHLTDDDVTVFSSMPRPASLDERTTWVQLPADAEPFVDADGTLREAGDLGDVTANGALHWAPYGHPGHQARLATMAAWIAGNPVSAFVVDVSVEVTMLTRLLGVPTVVFAQPGDRSDAPHRLGYDLADRILVPWAQGMFEEGELAGRSAQARWVGALSRYDGRAREQESDRRVLFLSRTLDAERLAQAIALLTSDGWIVDTAGAGEHDRVADVWPLLCRATVVVSAAGQNGVADLAAAGARAVVIAQDRPFGEQQHTLRVLEAQGSALTAPADVSARTLVDLIRRTAATTPAWDGWQVAGAAARAAAVIAEARL